MSYREKPLLKLYRYDSEFRLIAVIDDYESCSFERNLFQAGTFSIEINYNIPNATLFEKNLFIQFGNDGFDFGVITDVSDAISSEGKGSQKRTVTGYDARYILKRRIIKSLNDENSWTMMAKGEICLRSLIKSQCGSEAEEERRLPIVNVIPSEEDAIGDEVNVEESFTNLYDVCVNIATSSKIGWLTHFDGTELLLVCYKGNNLSRIVNFSTDMNSLESGSFSDGTESFCNSVYIGGKGTGSERDIYLGGRKIIDSRLMIDENNYLLIDESDRLAVESREPAGLDRFEGWESTSDLTSESEYEAEAVSFLNQYGETISMNGSGLAKSPYEYKKQYNVGDVISLEFSKHRADIQILSITEHWAWNSYEISFEFGKPMMELNRQMGTLLRKIQNGRESNVSESVFWYDVPQDVEQKSSEVIYDKIGFRTTSNFSTQHQFRMYYDESKRGAKTYHVYKKEYEGSSSVPIVLTTGVSGAQNLTLEAGTYVTIIAIDDDGNIMRVI